MQPKRKTHDDSPPEPYRGEEYSFDSNGCWCKPEYRDHALTAFIVRLCYHRRETMDSPAMVAETILASQYAPGFGTDIMANWLTLTSHADWPLAQTSRSGERVILDGGLGPSGVNQLHNRTSGSKPAPSPAMDF